MASQFGENSVTSLLFEAVDLIREKAFVIHIDPQIEANLAWVYTIIVN